MDSTYKSRKELVHINHSFMKNLKIHNNNNNKSQI